MLLCNLVHVDAFQPTWLRHCAFQDRLAKLNKATSQQGIHQHANPDIWESNCLVVAFLGRIANAGLLHRGC